MSKSSVYTVEEFKKNIKRNIKKKLAKLGWTPGRFAEEVGVTRGMVSKWLNGESCPGLTALARICTAMGEAPEYFLSKPVRGAK